MLRHLHFQQLTIPIPLPSALACPCFLCIEPAAHRLHVAGGSNTHSGSVEGLHGEEESERPAEEQEPECGLTQLRCRPPLTHQPRPHKPHLHRSFPLTGDYTSPRAVAHVLWESPHVIHPRGSFIDLYKAAALLFARYWATMISLSMRAGVGMRRPHSVPWCSTPPGLLCLACTSMHVRPGVGQCHVLTLSPTKMGRSRVISVALAEGSPGLLTGLLHLIQGSI